MNDDAAPSFAIDDVTHNEGDAGTTVVCLYGDQDGQHGVQRIGGLPDGGWNGGRCRSDYTAIPATTLNFAANETTKQVTVLVNGDTTYETDEAFTVHSVNATSATISDADGTGTIHERRCGTELRDR